MDVEAVLKRLASLEDNIACLENRIEQSSEEALKISSGNPLSFLGEYAEEASNFPSEQSSA